MGMSKNALSVFAVIKQGRNEASAGSPTTLPGWLKTDRLPPGWLPRSCLNFIVDSTTLWLSRARRPSVFRQDPLMAPPGQWTASPARRNPSIEKRGVRRLPDDIAGLPKDRPVTVGLLHSNSEIHRRFDDTFALASEMTDGPWTRPSHGSARAVDNVTASTGP